MSKESEKDEICCLKATSASIKHHPHKIVPLKKRNEITIGRSVDVTHCINSVMISRKHAILTPVTTATGDGWSICDNKSLNGISVNGNRLESLQPYTMKDGDIIQLGLPVSPDVSPDFVWKFHSKLRVRKIKGITENIHASVSASGHSQPSSTGVAGGCLKRPGSSSTSPKSSPSKRARFHTPALWSPSGDMKNKLEKQAQEAEKQLAEQAEKLAQMTKLLQEKDAAQERLQEELVQKEELMKEEMRNTQKQLVEERKLYEEQVKKDYEQQIVEKEKGLLLKLSEEKQKLENDKQKVEELLQSEMQRKLGEKDKHLEDELMKEKERLTKIINQKQLHEKMLESELSATKTENIKQKETILRSKEDLLSNFADVMETELQCSICNELFIKATSLNCSHSYCAHCLEQWKDVKKECPQCRAPITSQMRSIVLDSYIDRMVEHLSEEMKTKRKEMVEERKVEQAQREAQKAAAAARAAPAPRGPRARVRGRGRGRAARGQLARGRGAAAGAAAVGHPPPPRNNQQIEEIIIPDEFFVDATGPVEGEVIVSSDSSTSESDSPHSVDSHTSNSSVEGDEDHYYPGWGQCYRCGHRGHWANGCPFMN